MGFQRSRAAKTATAASGLTSQKIVPTTAIPKTGRRCRHRRSNDRLAEAVAFSRSIGQRSPSVLTSAPCTSSAAISPGSSPARSMRWSAFTGGGSVPGRSRRPSWRRTCAHLARDRASGRDPGRAARRDRARVRRRRLAHQPARDRPHPRRPRPLPRPAAGAHAPAQRAADARRPRRPGAAAAGSGGGDRRVARRAAGRSARRSPAAAGRGRAAVAPAAHGAVLPQHAGLRPR